MIGFFLGAACLIGLIKVARGPRWHRGWHHGYVGAMACGPSQGFYQGEGLDDRTARGGGSWHRSFDHHGHQGWEGPWGFAQAMADRLNLTDSQRETLWDTFKTLKMEGKDIKENARKIRTDFAKAMRSESFDEVNVGEAVGQFESSMDRMRKSFIEAFAKIHATLDPSQREMVAEMLERGPFARAFRRSVYRGVW